MKKPQATFTDLIDALYAQRRPKDDEGLSVRDIQDRLGRGEDWVRQRIKDAIKEGRVTVGRRNVTAIDGRETRVPIYMFKKAKG